jgi:Tfp pilus assembly protein PilE
MSISRHYTSANHFSSDGSRLRRRRPVLRGSHFFTPYTVDSKLIMKNLRCGFTLVEMAVSCVLLVALATVCLKAFVASAGQRRAIDQRQTAIREASNLLEKTTLLAWNELDKAADKSFVESMQTELQKELDGAEIIVDVAPEANDPTAKRIVVSIVWADKDNQQVQPVRLSAWRHRR